MSAFLIVCLCVLAFLRLRSWLNARAEDRARKLRLKMHGYQTKRSFRTHGMNEEAIWREGVARNNVFK